MALFTVIIGSAFHDQSEMIYLTEADNARSACEYVRGIAVAHNKGMETVMYCMAGQVTFCPMIFDAPNDALNEYVPTVIDLRQPKERLI